MVEKACFAAGCFWSVQEAFACVRGVVSTRAGYTGGDFKGPTYEDVCTGATGHAEAVEVEFDAEVVHYEALLEIFWSIHDPTAIDRQGPDIGSQYRSVIFFHSSAQKAIARLSKKRLEDSERFESPIATEILPAGVFYPAEDYHQMYLQKHGRSGCRR